MIVDKINTSIGSKILLRFKNSFFVVVFEKPCFEYLLNLIIVLCDPATTCNGHGECQEDGSCKCSDGFFGDSCSSISISFGLVLGQSCSLEFMNFMSFLSRIKPRLIQRAKNYYQALIITVISSIHSIL